MPTFFFLSEADRDNSAVVVDAGTSQLAAGLKTSISIKIGIPEDEQMLFLNGQPVQDDQFLSEVNHNRQHDLHFVLRLCGTVDIPVGRLTGDFVNHRLIRVDASDTISTIKGKIEEATGVSADDQRLVVPGSIKQDYRAVAEYLSRQLTRHVIVRLITVATIEVGPLTYGDRPIEIDVTPSTTIAEVKREIRNRWGIPLAQHRIYGENDDVAQLCGVTASELGIEAEGFVRLRVKAVGRLYVKADTFDGGFASIYALSSYTVARVKEMVQQETGFPPDQQRLMFNDQELGSGRLSDFVSERSRSLLLSLKRLLTVKVRDSANAVIQLAVTACISVEGIRRALWRHGYDMASRVSFNGRQLGDSERLSDETLSAVRRGAELAVNGCVRVSPFLIKVEDAHGRSLIVQCYNHYKVEDVKARIQDGLLHPPDTQRLIYAGQQLEDGRLIVEYGIDSNCTVHLVLRLRGS
ncbi:hypothetical protein FOZ60_007071 [Perkinsus olseni]|uniref:Ubiquitin-like domain-containing protein n=1 Tax=Perkinsus olseni TaxID=32597 RepID=A0A7J6NN58_PEROL|nr:hypothetical protein FOZ60_007071 [Perkinsus olseni]